RMPLAQRDLVPEDVELERPRVEVEELRQHPDVGALPHEEDGHEADDHADREAAAEQEAQVGGDPALGNHECAPSSRLSVEPSSRKPSPSDPTASPLPPGAIDTERIQLAASWIGSGSTFQVAPPSPVLSTVPESPTIHPFEPWMAMS